jgi:fatty acid-binding protein DegV
MILASALSLFPIMEVKRGPVELIDRVRSSKSVIPRLIDHVQERLGGNGPRRIGVMHADQEERAWLLKKTVEEQLNPDELFFEELNTILGIHAGPGALGLAYSLGI